MTRAREVIEGPVPQGEDERIAWTVDIADFGNTPTNIAVVAKDEDGADVTATVMTGSASATTTTITLPVLHSLTAGVQYRIEVKFDVARGDTLEGYFVVIAEV